MQYSYSCLDIHLLQTCANITYTFNSSVINQSGSYLISMYWGSFENEDVFGLRFAICVMYVRTLMVKKSLSSLALGGGWSKYSDMFSVLSSKWTKSPLICLAYFFLSFCFGRTTTVCCTMCMLEFRKCVEPLMAVEHLHFQ